MVKVALPLSNPAGYAPVADAVLDHAAATTLLSKWFDAAAVLTALVHVCFARPRTLRTQLRYIDQVLRSVVRLKLFRNRPRERFCLYGKQYASAHRSRDQRLPRNWGYQVGMTSMLSGPQPYRACLVSLRTRVENKYAVQRHHGRSHDISFRGMG